MQARSRRVKKEDEPRLETGVQLDEPIIPVFGDEGVVGNLSPGRLGTPGNAEDEVPLFLEEPVASGLVERRIAKEPELFADEDAILLNRSDPSRWLARRALALCTVMFVIMFLAHSRSSPPASAPPSNAAIPSETSARPSPRAATPSAPMASPSVGTNQVARVTEHPVVAESPAPSTGMPTAASAGVPAASQPPAYLPALPAPGPITGLGETAIQMAALPWSLPTPPAAASAMPAEPSVPSERLDETAGVRVVLARYVYAYASLDARAVAAVWPTVNQAALGRAFAALEAQNISFSRCKVIVSGATARAMCAGTAAWTPKIGGRRPREDERTWAFALTHRDDSWTIVSAEMR